jgi:hypothetical protein
MAQRCNSGATEVSMMAKRGPWGAAVSSCAVLLVAAGLWRTAPGPPALATSGLARTVQAPIRNDRGASELFQGAGSCASTACHGGPINSAWKWQSSYTVWATQDRHAKAYSVLYGPRSINMVRLIDGDKNKDPQPWTDARCLACHSTNGAAALQNETLAMDGVGCEACHGAAKNWLATHTSSGWTTLANKEQFGMHNTEDLVPRANGCVGCHVGDLEPTAGVHKEVNHDLIAAGHPRLAFEMAAYSANMPPHWAILPKNEKNAEPRAWVVGQLVAEQAASRLRVAHGVNELAEYDCYACHHNLQGAGWRTPPHEGSPIKSDRDALRLSTWHTGMSHQLAELGKANGVANGPVALEKWIEGQNAAGLRAIMSILAADGARTKYWDDATQLYLALLALDNARLADLKLDKAALPPNEKQLRDAISAMYNTLKFPPKNDSPGMYQGQKFLDELRKLRTSAAKNN